MSSLMMGKKLCHQDQIRARIVEEGNELSEIEDTPEAIPVQDNDFQEPSDGLT